MSKGCCRGWFGSLVKCEASLSPMEDPQSTVPSHGKQGATYILTKNILVNVSEVEITTINSLGGYWHDFLCTCTMCSLANFCIAWQACTYAALEAWHQPLNITHYSHAHHITHIQNSTNKLTTNTVLINMQHFKSVYD